MPVRSSGEAARHHVGAVAQFAGRLQDGLAARFGDLGEPRITSDTRARDTPARAATSSRVGWAIRCPPRPGAAAMDGP